MRHEMAADHEFLSLAVNAFIGLMSGVKFEDIFEEVKTVPKNQHKVYEFSTQDIASACILVIHDLTDGDMETIRLVGKMLSHMTNMEKIIGPETKL